MAMAYGQWSRDKGGDAGTREGAISVNCKIYAMVYSALLVTLLNVSINLLHISIIQRYRVIIKICLWAN